MFKFLQSRLPLQLSLFRTGPAEIPAPPRPKEPSLAEDRLLKTLWKELKDSYFPLHSPLDEYTIVWSKRPQKRTLASCSFSKKRVIVARELNHPSLFGWLKPLLYHEMCHAVLGDRSARKNERRMWHGRDFKKLEQRHPQILSLEKWIDEGGWQKAVRSDRARSAHQRRIKDA